MIRKTFLPLVALAAVLLLPAKVATADPPPGNGNAQVLATAVAATAGQTFSSSTFGYARTLTLCMTASGATTFSVNASIARVTFAQETLAGSATSANFTTTGAGSLCEQVTPAAYLTVTTSAAVTVTIQAQAAY